MGGEADPRPPSTGVDQISRADLDRTRIGRRQQSGGVGEVQGDQQAARPLVQGEHELFVGQVNGPRPRAVKPGMTPA